MDLLKQTKELCRLYDIKPARSKGQNFLIKEAVYKKIIETAELKQEDTILEVGPGLGFLTAELSKKAGKVIAVELDKKLAEILKSDLVLKGVKNVQLVEQDILKFQTAKYDLKDYKIIANLPYNITSIFLRTFLSTQGKPNSMVLMLQKEVAERIVAKPGKMSLLAVSVQFYAEPKIVEIIASDSFWPEPEVESAVIKINIKKNSSKINEREFFRLVKVGFSSKRKMLKNNLAAGYRLSQEKAEKKLSLAHLSPKIRAQELSVDDWLKLFVVFA